MMDIVILLVGVAIGARFSTSVRWAWARATRTVDDFERQLVSRGDK